MKNHLSLIAAAVVTSAIFLFSQESIAQHQLNHLLLHEGNYSRTFTKKQTIVITSQEQYAAILAAYTDDDPLQLDFNAGRVLLVDMGPRPTGGFRIEVERVEELRKGSIIVRVKLTRPGRTCLTTQALTNPYQFVYIRSRQELLINEELFFINC
ncbi:MAG TPA: protease complex subunit PrcB family protein [Pyrinomonadaceae bacterium]|nr:protease complex subunit PrcB family protein [Pyrinomonadaceae bacterium]